MAAVKTQIKKDPKEIFKPKVEKKKNEKTVKKTEKETETEEKVPKVVKKATQGQKLLQAMTAQKAAREALMKGVKNTKVSFDDEGNETVETVLKKLNNAKLVEKTRPAEKRKQEGEEVKLKKRAKKEKKSKEEQEEIRKDNKQEEAIEYVRLFVNDRKNWKFKKVQQIWILQNLYKIPEKEFDNVLKYLKDLQGSSREKTLKEAQEKIPKTAISNNLTGYANINDDDDDFDAEKLLNQVPKEQAKEQEDSPEVKRARLIVQVFL